MSLDRTRSKEVTTRDRGTKDCVTLRQVSWYDRGTFSVGNQTEARCQPERVRMWNDRMKVKEKQRVQKEKELGSPPKGLASYVTQHKCDSSSVWTHKLRTSLFSRKQSSTSTNRKPPTAQNKKNKKLSAAVRNTNRQRETQATADLLIHTWLCWHTTHNAIWRYILWPMPRSATTQGCFSSLSTFTADGRWWKLRLFNHLSQRAVRKREREGERER